MVSKIASAVFRDIVASLTSLASPMNDQTPADPSSSPAHPAGSPYGFSVACLKLVGWVLVACVGGLYGSATYGFFLHLLPMEEGHSGLMLLSFLVGTPLVVGVLVSFLARRQRSSGIASAGVMSLAAVALYVFAAGALLREGMICILMATPILLFFALVGALLGWVMFNYGGKQGPKLLSVALMLPMVIAPLESAVSTDSRRQQVVRSVYIDAPPSVVWRHINFPLNIQPAELAQSWAHRIGVPYPVEARTVVPGVGGHRSSRWQRGVAFEERITAWVPDQRIAWTYEFTPHSFPPGSLDDHIVMGGRYFSLDATSYTLHPEGEGCRLSIVVDTHVSTHFNAYAGWWAHWLVDDAAGAILQFYKQRAEAGSTAVARLSE